MKQYTLILEFYRETLRICVQRGNIKRALKYSFKKIKEYNKRGFALKRIEIKEKL